MKPFGIVNYASTLEHLRLDEDITDKDSVELCAHGALRYCLRYCENPNFTSVENLPEDFVFAYLLVLDDLWNKRREHNPAVISLLSPLRNLSDKV